MIPIAEQLIADLDRDRKKIVLPAPVITELLAPIEDEARRTDVLRRINLDFRVGMLDASAATRAGAIWSMYRDRWPEDYPQDMHGFRNRMKYDMLILGVALSVNAECLYTGDRRLFNLASRHMQSRNIFDTPPSSFGGIQTNLGFR